MVFSFYYTEKIAMIVLNKNPLMQEINKEKQNYKIESVNAQIDGDYIIPGINGIEVNVKNSFYNMKEAKTFNRYFLVFDQIKPEVSIADNKDKIIKNGNRSLKQVALVLEQEGIISDYLKSMEIKASLLVTNKTYKKSSYFEVINNDIKEFKTLEKELNLNKENRKICVINDLNKNLCKKVHNYLIDPELVLNSSNYLMVKKNLKDGSIILISNNANLDEVKLLIKEIKYKGMSLEYLSDLIDEKNENY